MEKRKVIERIQEYLGQELMELPPDAEDRKKELERLLVLYRFLPQREYGRDEVIIPSMLVELELNGTTAFYFIAPQGGGLITQIDGRPVQVITPQSPLGEALLGKKWGAQFDIETRGKVRTYRVVSFC